MVSIGVYGATGYTGRFVAAELVQRGHHVILGGRDAAGLAQLAATLDAGCEVCPARIDDADALRRFAKRCAVLINCAGPFSRYGQPAAEAAIAAGAHYLDHTSEPAYVHRLMGELGRAARRAGVTVVAGMTFYTGIADLIARRLAAPMGPVSLVKIAYAIKGWQLTPASLATAAALADSDRVTYRDGTRQVSRSSSDAALAKFAFPLPVGVQPVITEYQGCCEAVTVPRHTRTAAVETCITVATFAGTDLTSHPGSPDASAHETSTQFTTVVDAYNGTDHRRSWISGSGDLYRIGAVVSAEAAGLLAAGKGAAAGVVSPAEAFAETGLLDSLLGMSFIEGGLHTEINPQA